MSSIWRHTSARLSLSFHLLLQGSHMLCHRWRSDSEWNRATKHKEPKQEPKNHENQRTTRTREPQEPENYENQRNQKSQRTRELENQKKYRKKTEPGEDFMWQSRISEIWRQLWLLHCRSAELVLSFNGTKHFMCNNKCIKKVDVLYLYLELL